MCKLNIIYVIICEGNSEVVYIQELNKYFRDQRINITLVPRSASMGCFEKVIEKYKCEKKKSNKSKFCIWVANDIYKRNDNQNNDKYIKKSERIPNFHFNYYNFEDFLILHLDKNSILEYQNKCEGKKHFNIPMKKKVYTHLIKNIFNDYKKGNLPADFVISKESLDKLFKNNQDMDIKLRSDFAKFMLEMVEKEF